MSVELRKLAKTYLQICEDFEGDEFECLEYEFQGTKYTTLEQFVQDLCKAYLHAVGESIAVKEIRTKQLSFEDQLTVHIGAPLEVPKPELLTLGDLQGWSELDIRQHLANEYTPEDTSQVDYTNQLNEHHILIAYESVGSWGCDSSSFFLLQNKKTGKYFSIYGSHCSCYGFEGQGDLEPIALEYMQSEHFAFYTGGYDDYAEANRQAVKTYISILR